MPTKAFTKHFIRPKNIQPVCTEIFIWKRYDKCQFLFGESGLFGCQAGGVHPSWAIKESPTKPGSYLADYKDLILNRNYRINTCPYRIKFWLMEIFTPLVKLIKWFSEKLSVSK